MMIGSISRIELIAGLTGPKLKKEFRMKRTIVATTVMLLAVSAGVHATQRLVLGEFFTNTS